MQTFRVVEDGRYNKVIYVLKRNETIETHSHPGNDERITVLCGCLSVWHNEADSRLEEGQQIEMPAKQEHSIIALGGTAVFICEAC
jgi:quercetin dioxygenase-like cupin family protein